MPPLWEPAIEPQPCSPLKLLREERVGSGIYKDDDALTCPSYKSSRVDSLSPLTPPYPSSAHFVNLLDSVGQVNTPTSLAEGFEFSFEPRHRVLMRSCLPAVLAFPKAKTKKFEFARRCHLCFSGVHL